MNEAVKAAKSTANSYVVVGVERISDGSSSSTVIGSWSNKDKAIRQAFEETGKTLIMVFNPVTGVLIETITKG